MINILSSVVVHGNTISRQLVTTLTTVLGDTIASIREASRTNQPVTPINDLLF